MPRYHFCQYIVFDLCTRTIQLQTIIMPENIVLFDIFSGTKHDSLS